MEGWWYPSTHLHHDFPSMNQSLNADPCDGRVDLLHVDKKSTGTLKKR